MLDSDIRTSAIEKMRTAIAIAQWNAAADLLAWTDEEAKDESERNSEMLNSSFEKFRINDIPINEYPAHAEEYAAQITDLNRTFIHPLSAEEMLSVISKRILNHTYQSDCIQCIVEPKR